MNASDNGHKSDTASVLLSRGFGYLALSAVLLIKRTQLGPMQMADIGYQLALAMLVVGPIASASGQVILRRVLQSHHLNGCVGYLWIWVLSAVAALFSGTLWIAASHPAEYLVGEISIACAFALLLSLVGALILWLRLMSRYLWSWIIVFSGALSILVLGVLETWLDVPLLRRSFTLETVALLLVILPIMIYISAGKNISPEARSIPLNVSTVGKYVLINVFASGILAVDWYWARTFLETATYAEWAQIRLGMERIVLPVLNALSSVVLIRLIRRNSGASEMIAKESHWSPKSSVLVLKKWVLFAFGILVLCIVLLGIVDLKYGLVATALLGYTLFGILSIFLDFLAQRSSALRLALTAIATLAAYALISYLMVTTFSARGAAVFWVAANSLMIVTLYLNGVLPRR